VVLLCVSARAAPVLAVLSAPQRVLLLVRRQAGSWCSMPVQVPLAALCACRAVTVVLKTAVTFCLLQALASSGVVG